MHAALMGPASSKPVLDGDRAAFIQGAVSVVAASGGPGRQPAIARTLGCRVSRDRRRVEIFLAASQSAPLIEAVQATRALAVVFSEPSSHRTLQLKGCDAAVGPAGPEAAKRIGRYVEGFVGHVAPLGFDPAVIRAMFWHEPSDVVCIAFTPGKGFDQTPGPRAGAPI